MTISEQKIKQYREGLLEFQQIESFLSISERLSLIKEIPGRIEKIQKKMETNQTTIDGELVYVQNLEKFIRESRKLITKKERHQEDLEAQKNELSKIYSRYSELLKTE